MYNANRLVPFSFVMPKFEVRAFIRMMSTLWLEGRQGRGSISVETGDISLSHLVRIGSGLLLTLWIENGVSLPCRKLCPALYPITQLHLMPKFEICEPLTSLCVQLLPFPARWLIHWTCYLFQYKDSIIEQMSTRKVVYLKRNDINFMSCTNFTYWK